MRAPASQSLLRVEHLGVGLRQRQRRQKRQHTIRAVEDVSLTVNAGEIVGIVGESGCGKSLTALSVMGLLPAAMELVGGSIVFENERLDQLRERNLNAIRGNRLTMIFQEPMSSLNPLMRIGRQLAEPLVLHGVSTAGAIRERVLEAMGKVGLRDPETLLRAYPHQLSGGMLQRVMIAAAIVCRPRLIIADEPTTALDVTTQAQILRLLRQINQTDQTSILFISHDLGVINQICDQVLVMYAGRIVERGTVGNVLWHPVHEYTKGLIKSIPTRRSKGAPLPSIRGRVPALAEEKAGCAFAPRCPAAHSQCFLEVPDELALSDFHQVNCFLADVESEMEYVRI
ncbi:MAG: ABC transporter ATP-binding protein [Coriobacteriales bacterium]|nr:ABC transporter ATP-binding protein [Coriobacteriales bacterium]